MKLLPRNEQGSALIIELIVLALVLVAAGFAAYQYASHKRAVNQATTPKPHVVAEASPSTSATPTPTQKPANEFDVPELGFKMILPQGLIGLTYKVFMDQAGSDANGVPYRLVDVRFTTASLAAADSNCNVDSGPLGSFAKYPFNPIGRISAASTYNTKQLGSNYLVHVTPQQPCSSNNSVDETETSLLPLITQAFNTATPL